MDAFERDDNAIPVITVDGPTASGKGTVAHRVADALEFHYLDSGALYRLTALASARHGIAPDDADALSVLAETLDVRFSGQRIWLSGEDVTDAIRAEAIGNRASAIAVHGAVRHALLALQHGFRKAPGLVADGRDMGTVVFPDAVLKVFLTASVQARAQRRYKQLIGKGFSANIDSLLLDLQERDARDRTRAEAPLRPAEGARVLDTSGMTADQAVAQVLEWFSQAQYPQGA
ncbi:(d)CMP kinase [Pandoraea sp.]|uniref:(d)CMP kinase n=1 Tax=Pandoraea sp. TaxID=1883445 RepID=UPI00121DF6E6|nr:(d)CMP kinase [Pandoraea sp.]TAL57105.1 MAG: (d)CMP kinase [Pandoraea sp.]TAM18146.1 MAG: (d)CMP kinase [Pandoraea sp.]